MVDDDPLFRWAIRETLDSGGYAVVEAGDARSALEAFNAAARRVDVVFLDVQLPDCNDLRLLSEIRHLAPSPAVVVMTAFGSDVILADACALGAVAVVDKPLELSTVLALVDRALAARPR